MEKKKSITKGVRLNPKQEKTIWCGIVDQLKKHELLPVVNFTFSRARCDSTAESLMHLDLTTQSEKSAIHTFFNRCVRCLKEPDRHLPQIEKMYHILTKGIGVHHSGMLPIVKEMVEMLFQRRLIKVCIGYNVFRCIKSMEA